AKEQGGEVRRGEQGRKITDIDADAEVNLEYVIDVDGKAVAEEIVKGRIDEMDVDEDIALVQDKGKKKAKLIEEPMKLKKKDQILFDEEVAKKLQEEIYEKERLVIERARQEEEANNVLIKSWKDIQAKVLDLENKVIKMKSSHKAKIAELKSRVEKLEEANRSLTKELQSFNTEVKDKGKAKLDEEPKVLKSRKTQIAIDEEVTRMIEVKWNSDMKDNI
nr:hypothetical protein [Tanacetum cinerariifolium]